MRFDSAGWTFGALVGLVDSLRSITCPPEVGFAGIQHLDFVDHGAVFDARYGSR